MATISEVHKTYRLVEKDGRRCQVTVVYEDTFYGGQEADYCGIIANFCIDIETISLSGKRVVSKVGFCSIGHVPRRYKQWFKLEADPCSHS